MRDFIQHNYTPYEGDEAFLAQATPATTALWQKVMVGIRQENATHAPVDFDTNIATTITAHGPGYIDQELETIVGLQTDKPLKRALHPYGGINMIRSSFEAYGREMDPQFEYLFTDLRKTHNQGVFDVYSPEMMRCRKSGVLTGLPDGYGRGRIIGDYRRVALYGISYLVRERELQFADLQGKLERGEDLEATIRLREELAEHKRALLQIQQMAANYGFDISRPAMNAQEAVQWVYFAYLAAVKSQNGGAMSLGRTASFLDIYIERDMQAGRLNEVQAQELIDHFIMKIRMLRLRLGPLPAHAGVRHALLRRSDLGHGSDWRHGAGWPHAGDQKQLPLPAYPAHHGACAGAKPDDPLVPTTADRVQEIRRAGVDRHLLAAIRERRSDARRLQQRRLRHCLLRQPDGDRQADAVLRRTRQPGENAAVRNQRRGG